MVSNPSSAKCTITVRRNLHLKPCFPICLQCGRAFDPNFLFLWPNARVSLAAPGCSASLLPPGGQREDDLEEKLKEESPAFFSSARLWDDGVILPQDTRKVKTQSPSPAPSPCCICFFLTVFLCAGSWPVPGHHQAAAVSALHAETVFATFTCISAFLEIH